jgi:hypothetical protein
METLTDSMAQRRGVIEYVRDEPLTVLAIAGAAGFVLGGGINRRLGFAMMTMVGRIAVRSIAASLIFEAMNSGRDRGKQRRTRHFSGRHDNGRTNFQEPG